MQKLTSRMAAVFGATLLMLLPTTALADSPWLYGIHWYGDPGSNQVEVMTGNKGIWCLEIVLTEDSTWSVSTQLSKFQTEVNRGHTLIVRVQPRWSLNVPGPNDSNVAVADRMETFIPKVIQVAQTLAPYCHIWQVGNEPNLQLEYDIGNLTPDLCADKYKEIRDAIKTVTSSLGPQIVLLPPTAPVDTAYLGGMIDRLAQTGGQIDGFAMHAYGGARGAWVTDINTQATFIDSKGHSTKPIYITEWGAPVDPLSETNVHATADFLYDGFAQLNTYNNTAGKHPIVCACWFIYDDQPYWINWSILGIRNANIPGVQYDLYDKFQQAAAQNYPAGDDFGGGASTPFIARSPAALTPLVAQGQNAASQTFTISNGGVGTLNYTITDDVGWLSVTPSAGNSSGEVDTITVNYTTSNLAIGTYGATITITDPNATNSPQSIAVTLNVQADVNEPEIVNPDFEDDPGFFNVATGWTGFGGNKWERVIDGTGRVNVQGMTDIPPSGGVCGVYQIVDTTPGIEYRVAVYGKSHNTSQGCSIGVDPNGGTSVNNATFGTASTTNSWVQVTHDFVAAGNHATIFLRGKNNGSIWLSGAWCLFDAVTIEVIGSSNNLPTAVATANPTSGDEPLTVNFDGSNSSDPDSGDTLSYDWDFDDGSAHATTVSPQHMYNNAGTYNVVLTVNDGHGGIDTDMVTIQVNEPPPATVAPDFNGDTDVDVADFAYFQTCFSGATQAPPAGCEDADFDGDIDVDVADFAEFSRCFNGAARPPACE